MDKAVLIEIGLTDYESEVYLALLKHGQMSAYGLAEKTGMYRQATYDALNRLIEKGYVNSVKEGKSQLYSAVDPKLVLEYLNEKVDQYKEILPKLTELSKESQQPLAVETYRGSNTLRIAFRDIINTLKETKGELLCTSVDENMALPENKIIYDHYERDMINYGLKERVLIKEGAKGVFKKGTSKYRMLPVNYHNPNPVQVYGNNVQIILWGHPDHLIIIRNRDVANSFRKQFELMWRAAEMLK